jgi:hypothetical protein
VRDHAAAGGESDEMKRARDSVRAALAEIHAHNP